MRWPWLALALAIFLAAPALAQQAPSGRAASFLVYHAPGGRDPDPLASPLAAPPAGAQRLPATIFDNAQRADTAPENSPEKALAHYREFQRILLAREAIPAGAELRVNGTLKPGALSIEIRSNVSAEISFVVFEHGVLLNGRPEPYVARFRGEPENGTRLAVDVHLDPAWDASKIGVVAIARAGEDLLNSATWTVAHDAPIVQTERAVLVEHATASWCDACRPADDALALLATQRGVAGDLPAPETRYFRSPSWLAYAGLALGAAAAIVVVRRREP